MDGYSKACRIFEILSAFEESSAECMTEMLVHFSNQQYASGVIQASKFIAHIDVLFAAIDSIESSLARHKSSLGLVHTKEPKQLAKKIVRFFSLLTHTRESTHTPRGEITKDLICLVTGLAHTHKVLIRIALNGALTLEKRFGVTTATEELLDRFLSLGTATSALPTRTQISDIKTDLCPGCRKSVEDACIKYAFNTLRWHAGCFKCKSCRRVLSSSLSDAVCDGITVLCSDCAQTRDGFVEGSVSPLTGFKISRSYERVSQLEQYVFLLRCALKRLCGLLNVRFEDWPQGSEMLVSQRIRNLTLLKESDQSTLARTADNASNRLGSLPLALAGVETAATVDGVRARPYSTLIPIQPATIQPSPNTKRTSSFDEGARFETSPNWEALNIEQGALAVNRRLHNRFATANITIGRSGRDSDRASLHSQNSMRNRAKSFSGSLVSRRLSGRSGGELAKKPDSLNSLSEGAQQQSSIAQRLPTRDAEATRDDDSDEEEEEDLEDDAAAMVSPLNFASDSSHSRRSRPGYSSAATSFEDELSLAALSLDAGKPFEAVNSSIVTNHGPPPVPLEPSPAQQALAKRASQTSAKDPALKDSQKEASRRVADIPVAPSSCNGELRFLSELSALESFMVRQFAVVALHPLISDYFSLNELMELVEMRKMSIWEKMVSSLKGSSKRASRQKSDGTFGVSLELLVDQHGVNSDLAFSPGQVRIPLAVDVCIQALYRSDLESEGVFRKNGNIKRLRQMADIMDGDPSLRTVQWNLAKHNAVQLAALLKKFLRDLPEPLLTFKLHEMFCVSQKLDSASQQKECLHLLLCLLPKPNRDLLEILMFLLIRVAKLSSTNRMDLDNLATVIAPNILYSKSKNPVDDQSPLAISAVRALLEHAEEFCLVPQTLWTRMRQQSTFNEPLQSLPSTFKPYASGTAPANVAGFSKLPLPPAPVQPPSYSSPPISEPNLGRTSVPLTVFNVQSASAPRNALPSIAISSEGSKPAQLPIHPYLQHHSQPNSPFVASPPLTTISPAAMQQQQEQQQQQAAQVGQVGQMHLTQANGLVAQFPTLQAPKNSL